MSIPTSRADPYRANRTNRKIFPPTPPADPELPGRPESPTHDAEHRSLEHPLVGDPYHNLPSERTVLCPYFLKNPHLVPEHSPCRLRNFPDVQHLKAHIEEDHKIPLRTQLSGDTELERFQDVWMQVFTRHQGYIPEPYTWNREMLRKQQNLRVIQIHERYIKAKLWDQPDILKSLDEIFEQFRKDFGPRNKFAYPFLPDTTSSMPLGSGTAAEDISSDQRTSGNDHNLMGPESGEMRNIGVNDVPPPSSTRDQPDRQSLPGPLMSLLSSVGRNVLNRVMEDFLEIADNEYLDSESVRDDSFSDRSSNEPGEDSGDSCSDDSSSGCTDDTATLAASDDGDQGSPTDAGGQRAHQSSNSTFPTQSGSSRGPTTGTGNGNYRAEGSEGNGSNLGGDAGDGGRKRKRPISPTSIESEPSSKRFSCPYFKKYPDRPKQRSCCNPPGFEDVNRVKEHIYRVHKPVSECPRCHGEFPNDNAVMVHLASDERCDRGDPQEKRDSQSVTNNQVKELKSKRNMRGFSQEERWRKVYRIIFALDENVETPSPYYEQSSWYFEKYKRFSRQHLPEMVRARLERRIGEQLREQLTNVIRECQELLFSNFQELEQSDSLEGVGWGEAEEAVQDPIVREAEMQESVQTSVGEDDETEEAAQDPVVGALQAVNTDWSTFSLFDDTSMDPFNFYSGPRPL